jgi:hypothetical protein
MITTAEELLEEHKKLLDTTSLGAWDIYHKLNEMVKKTPKKKSRAEQAGENIGKGIKEASELMYQENTKSNFFKGIKNTIGEEL